MLAVNYTNLRDNMKRYMDQVTDDALQNAEQNGIIFIDEIDKIA